MLRHVECGRPEAIKRLFPNTSVQSSWSSCTAQFSNNHKLVAQFVDFGYFRIVFFKSANFHISTFVWCVRPETSWDTDRHCFQFFESLHLKAACTREKHVGRGIAFNRNTGPTVPTVPYESKYSMVFLHVAHLRASHLWNLKLEMHLPQRLVDAGRCW